MQPKLDPWRIDHLTNVGRVLYETAQRMPDALAVACPAAGQAKKLKAGSSFRYDSITFQELESSSNQVAHGLVKAGIRPGMRIALMVPPGIEFVRQVFALYKTGAVTILIDPGMGRKNMIRCLADAKPEGLVGIRKAHLARWIFRNSLGSCKFNVSTDGYFPWCLQSRKFQQQESSEWDAPAGSIEDDAAIIFTTGSTGPPKGVLYRHRNFLEQASQIRDYFDIRPGSVDVSGFPLFALFNAAMGTTTVFPEMDATRPAEIYPPNLIDAVDQFSADQSFGSPALWNTVSQYCLKHQLKLPTITRVLTAGAPVPPSVLNNVKQIVSPQGDVFTPYGATEALPVACNSATEVLSETAQLTHQGHGTCVGKKFDRVQWRVIRISDEPISRIQEVEVLPAGEIGELMVQGPQVTDQYVTRTDANAEHKVKDGGSFWHRMGDVGYMDEHQRFWFCGRKSHRVQTEDGTLYTVRCEAIFNTHPSVYRSALVGLGSPGQQIPVVVVEPLAECWTENAVKRSGFIRELHELAQQHELTRPIQHILLKQALPVDIRHNSKIFREQIRPWAEEQLRHGKSVSAAEQ